MNSESNKSFLKDHDQLTDERLAILASILNASDDAIISKTLDGIIIGWNKSAQKMFGYTEDEAKGKSISIIIPADRLKEEVAIIEKIRRGEKVDHFETIRVSKDGTQVEVSLTISPIRNKDGQVIGAVKVARDIGYSNLAEEKQARLAAIVSSSDDAIISKTLEGIITSWNEAATHLFGFTESEAIGKPISIIIPPDRMDEETLILNKIKKGEKIQHFETIRVAKDGRLLNISLTVSPLKNKNGHIIGASKVARDISSKVEAEKQRQLYTEKLKELNDYKDEFMVMASHELKTPLTVILANLQMLESQMVADANIGFITRTIKQTKKLSDLISNLLDVSKIQAGKLELNPSLFDINILIAEVADNLQQITIYHQLIFEGREKILMVNADRERIEHVIINILSNAIKYSPEGGKIIINSRPDEDKIIVTVSDKGIGMHPDDLENIFTRFYRVHGLASSFSGSGVGLYIASEIVKRHGGAIWAESELGRGSVFYISIPKKA